MKKLSRQLLLSALLIFTVLVATACSTTVTVPETVEEPVEAVVEEAAEVVEEAVEEAEEVMEEAEEVVEEAAEVVEEAAEEVVEEAAEEVVEEVMEEVAMAAELDINFALGNNQRTLTYNQSTPLEQPDGNVISQGQLKPTWQYIQSELGIGINDVTIQDQKSGEMIDVSAATNFDGADIFGGSGIADDLMAYGAQGYFVRLNDRLDQMPNFAAYLDENPNIAKAITAYDGGIYHVAYAAEIGNYARVFNARTEWITGLLDSDDMLEAETHSLTTAYSGYWDRNGSNAVDMQNDAAGGAELTAEVARAALLEYIAASYPDLANPSDLYVGVDAQYDIDELVALWRLVELSPNTVTKITTGEVVADAQVDAFFTRRSKDRFDAFRLIPYWGGQRVFGSDATGARFYTDADGELQFSFNDPGFLEAVGYMQQLSQEGLIHADFSDTSNTDNFRSVLYGADGEEGHNQFGFMTIDWIASTTASNETVESVLPPLTQVGSDEWIHFVENTRVIKPDGWSISTASSEEEINSALALFDYFYSDEGVIVQNYGPPFVLEEGAVYLGGDGVEYPQFNQWALDNSAEFKNGNMSSFMRDYLGSLIPLGYQKQIGFEMQTTINNGPAAWEMYFTKGVVTPSYESADPLFRLVPPVFSLTEQDSAKLGQLAVGEEQAEQIFLFITDADTALESTDALATMYADAGVEDYLEVYRTAYARSQE
jgi:hypothetical protein